jgi:putative transposase
LQKEKKMTIEDKVIDDMLKDYERPEDVIGANGLLQAITKRVLERVMAGELTHHVGYEKHDVAGNNSGNSRNGSSVKTIKGTFGTIPIEVPRDRNGTFEPKIIEKGQTRFKGFDENIISLYARGLSTREIKQNLEEIYQVEVSPALISIVTEEVMEEVRAWQNRLLASLYVVVYFDALHFKVRDSGRVRNKAVYVAIGINLEGCKEVLGLWVADTEGAKFWMQVFTELQNRGVKDMIIACVDGLKGLPEAIQEVFSKTEVQLCIVHMVRNSLRFVGWKQKKEVAQDLRMIYTSPNENEAERALEEFAAKWDDKFPAISKSWYANWVRVIPFFSHPQEIRKIIYTTNAIESLNMSLRKVTKTRSSFPNDDALLKLLFLALRNIEKKWTKPVPDWQAALNRFAIIYEGRIPVE